MNHSVPVYDPFVAVAHSRSLQSSRIRTGNLGLVIAKQERTLPAASGRRYIFFLFVGSCVISKSTQRCRHQAQHCRTDVGKNRSTDDLILSAPGRCKADSHAAPLGWKIWRPKAPRLYTFLQLGFEIGRQPLVFNQFVSVR